MSAGYWNNRSQQPSQPPQPQHPQNTQNPQHSQHPQHVQLDGYQQNLHNYGYPQIPARGLPQPIQQNDHSACIQPNAYNCSPHQQQYVPQQQQRQQSDYHYLPFMFNANASVFVPRKPVTPPQEYGYYGGSPMYQQQYHQPYQQHYQLNQYGATSAPSSSYNAMYQPEDAAIDAFAQFGQQSQQYLPSTELHEQISSSKCSSFLTEILVGCEQLIAEGEEDSPTWIAAIRQRFEDPQMDDDSKKIGVRLIFEMSYSIESNQFRGTDPQHTYSNLLMTLSREIKDFLRRFIVPILGEFHEARKRLENDSRVYMAVFYAEVFVKLTLENGSRFEMIGKALADQIDEILKFTLKDEYMKCLLRVFKVAGAEMDSSEELRSRVDSILTIMGAYAKGSPILGDSIKAQIFSLIECRTRGWDRVVTRGIEHRAGNVADCDRDSFDESQDNDLTDEERQFLESHLDQVENRRGGEEELDDQEVMDEFGKFVKEELLQVEELKTAGMFENLNIENEDDKETPTEKE